MICMISHSVETPRGTGAFFFNTLRLRRPMRAGIFSVLLFSSQPLRLFNPLALYGFATPCNAMGHGRGGV